jgi:hypothetical protein
MNLQRLLGAMVQAILLLLAAACSSVGAVPDATTQPPLDAAVLVTGSFATVAADESADAEVTFGPDMPTDLQPLVDALQSAQVFRRIGLDPAPGARSGTLPWAEAGAARERYLQQARDDGYDWLLVVEGLRDGPIESQGINGRWPITLGTWFLVGLGFLIPDHGFESRAILRVSVRDLESGRVLYESLVNAGPVELSLVERSSALGLLTSIVVPPFWVADDEAKVGRSVRGITLQRLLQFVARELKSPTARQRLRDGSVAAIEIVQDSGVDQLRITSRQALSVVRLRQQGVDSRGAEQQGFERSLLASMRPQGDQYRYEAPLPAAREGLLQVVVVTIEGEVVSATFDTGRRP